jgi:hypothetical protein
MRFDSALRGVEATADIDALTTKRRGGDSKQCNALRRAERPREIEGEASDAFGPRASEAGSESAVIHRPGLFAVSLEGEQADAHPYRRQCTTAKERWGPLCNALAMAPNAKAKANFTTARWLAAQPGVWQVELPMVPDGPVGPVRAFAVRMGPSKARFTLGRRSRDHGLSGDWSVTRIPADGAVAANAGQLSGGAPCGWLVIDRSEVPPPGSGTLGMAFVVDVEGTVSLGMPAEIPAVGASPRAGNQS